MNAFFGFWQYFSEYESILRHFASYFTIIYHAMIKTYGTEAERFVLVSVQCRFPRIVVYTRRSFVQAFPFHEVGNSSVFEEQMKSVSSNVFSGTVVIVRRATAIPETRVVSLFDQIIVLSTNRTFLVVKNLMNV